MTLRIAVTPAPTTAPTTATAPAPITLPLPVPTPSLPLPTAAQPVLLSHPGCPYVQRVAIVLAEKGLAHRRHDIDLRAKTDAFLRLSPLGQIPVLLLATGALFESIPICEYLDDVHPPSLHPAGPLARAQARAWMALVDGLLQAIGAYYKAGPDSVMTERRHDIERRLATLEERLVAGGESGTGPYFDGARFGLVDAVAASALRYFDAFTAMGTHNFLAQRPRVDRWRQAVLARPSVQAAVPAGFQPRLVAYLLDRDSALARQSAHARGTGVT